MNFKELLKLCDAKIVNVTVQHSWQSKPSTYEELDQSSPFKIPPELYFKITSTSTKDTIGRLIEIETKNLWNGTFLLEIDGRPKPSKISSYYAKYLEGYSGPTIWVRNITKHDKKPSVVNPVNKYNQMLQKDDWVIGLTGSGTWKRLSFGQITRWTNSNVWMKETDVVNLNKRNPPEIKLCSIKETFIMPNDDFIGSLMWTALGGKYKTSDEEIDN